ncbi:MAG: ABC transporter ATP-binding protein [Candidatus Bathyarchaeota archaeon]|nr:MAG: ABC transporter ATP-binding protein [Candidatus Bathyarchaeota archaeon]
MAYEAVASHNLLKTYGGSVEALRGVAISIQQGELFTLLGPNGAGKTTYLRIIATQLLPTKGDAEVLGYDVVEEAKQVRQHIAVVPQDAAAYGNYTPWDYAYYFAKLRGMPSADAKQAAKKALEDVELFGLRNRVCASLSGGEKKRAIIASALASKAEVLMLDEPTSGLDAVARRGVWSALRDMVREGKTILLTTHIMEEAEMVSDRLAIIHNGTVIADGSPDRVKQMAKEKFRVVVRGKINSLPAAHDVVKLGDKQIIYVSNEDEALELVRKVLKKGLNAEAAPITLEDVFVKLVGGWNS